MNRIIFYHPDMFVLAGDIRATLMFADLFKYIGFDVLFIYTDLRPVRARYYTLSEIREYHPIKYLNTSPCNKDNVCGNFQQIPHYNLRPQLYDYLIKLEEYSYLFTDKAETAFMGDDDAPVKVIYYIHYPDRPVGPRKAMLWANSTYISSITFDWWGRKPKVVYPPLHLDVYNGSLGFNDRDYDVVMFGQLYHIKGFSLAERLAKMGYRVAVVGAKVEKSVSVEHGSVDLYKNLTVRQYTDILSRSKVYIHARPGEHFGITITEAMASGVPVVVHMSGGQWSDVIERGKYGFGFFKEEEVYSIVKKLTSEREYWEKYHRLSLIGSKRFGFKLISERVKELLAGV